MMVRRPPTRPHASSSARCSARSAAGTACATALAAAPPAQGTRPAERSEGRRLVQLADYQPAPALAEGAAALAAGAGALRTNHNKLAQTATASWETAQREHAATRARDQQEVREKRVKIGVEASKTNPADIGTKYLDAASMARPLAMLPLVLEEGRATAAGRAGGTARRRFNSAIRTAASRFTRSGGQIAEPASISGPVLALVAPLPGSLDWLKNA